MNQRNAEPTRPSRPMLALLADRQAATPDHISAAHRLEACRAALDPQQLGPRVTYFAGSRERIAL